MPAADLPRDVSLTYSRQYRRCGKAGCAACVGDGPGHGPCWYAYWREGRRVRSCYVGKTLPSGATESVRAARHERSAPLPALRVRTLGGFEVRRGDELIPARRWRRRGAAALFTLLLGAPGQRLHREQIADALWPQADPAAGAMLLRSALYQLRAVLDAPTRHEPVQAGDHVTGRCSYVRSEGRELVLVPALDGEPPARLARRAGLHGRRGRGANGVRCRGLPRRAGPLRRRVSAR